MTVVIAWIVEGTWPACVDAARTYAPDDAAITLLHVTAPEVPGAARGAYAGLLGRARPERDPGTRLEHLAAASAGQLLDAAAERLGARAPAASASAAPSGKSWPPPKAPACSSSPATATAPASGRAASARPAASSSTMPPAPSCWSGPNPRPAWPPSRRRHRTTASAGPRGDSPGRADDPRRCPWDTQRVTTADETTRTSLLRRGFALEYATLAWNVAGIVVLAVAAVSARSVALAGFGLDSLIEIGASTVVIWELSGGGEARQIRALRLIGGGFALLAAYLLAQSTWVLAAGYRPHHSPLGIGWTAVTAAVMLALAARARPVPAPR